MSTMPPENPYSPSANLSPQDNLGDQKLAKEIKSQAIASLVVGIISFICCGIVLAPFAIYRGNKAKSLIDQTGIGREHRGTAQAGFIIGIISLVLNILILGFYLLMGILGAISNH